MWFRTVFFKMIKIRTDHRLRLAYNKIQSIAYKKVLSKINNKKVKYNKAH